ncbi:MAG: histidine kinase [Clostridiaceae bacterium]|nr:histidine kinase [Clostridiaceae bacterium]
MFKTLKSRLISVSLLFLIVGIILPVVITSNIFVKQIQTENENSTVLNFSRTASRINEMLASAAVSAFRVQNENEVNDYLVSGYLEKDPSQKTLKRIDFYKSVEKGLRMNDNLNAILFIRSDDTMCGVSSTWHFFEDGNNKIAAQMNQRSNVSQSGYSSAIKWLGAFPKTDFTETQLTGTLSSSDLLICGVRKLTNSLQPAGRDAITMLVSVKETSLQKCFELLADAESSVCLLDETGMQISGTDFSLFGTTPNYYDMIDKNSQYGSKIYTSDNKTEYQVIYYHLGYPNWMLVKMMPTSVQHRSTNMLLSTAIAIGCALLILMTVLYTIWAIHFTEPVNQVTKALLRVKEGDLELQIAESANTQEVLTMQQQFNQMIRSINELLEQKEKNEQETLLLEMQNLQTQIDPHLIYNSIASIRWMAIFAGADKVSDMLVILSNLLRPIFNDWTLVWSLDEELKFTNNYINLVRMRYGDSINIKIQMDLLTQDLESFQIPRFTLQPLLENSCEHGMRPEQPLEITVRFTCVEDLLTIRVVDNGAGMAQDTMEWLNARFADPVSTQLPKVHKSVVHSNGIGMININRRLKLQYGESYGLRLSVPENGGTCVEVRLRV